jgi:hypothetical protein
MWRTKRQTKDSDWGAPVNLGQPVNSEFYDYCGMISADGSMLYFSGNPAGAADDDLWQASVIPIVDFNGDRIVDVRDLVRLIESWGKDDPAVDIGPMPWGDGKVDRADLEVFMRYWGQEPYDATLMAHWKLDEAAGIVAADRVGANSGTLVGNPIWQPAGGKVGGALQLDGIDDSVRLPFVVDPANGLFSIFVWIKSGAPGQAILSVIGGADWLKADEILGCLMTNLPQGTTRGKTPTPLLSQSPITDGQWHRVGLVWTGKNRILYVDGIEVAQDTPSAPLLSCSSGLNLGTSSTLAPGTFWKGLIDDVRIYNRAVRP